MGEAVDGIARAGPSPWIVGYSSDFAFMVNEEREILLQGSSEYSCI